MAEYVDGFVLPVPSKNMEAYKKLAKLACKVWIEHGALDYRETVIDGSNKDGGKSFPTMVKPKKGETIVFAWIVYKSRAQRDKIIAKVMDDPRLAGMEDNMPFDYKRMAYAGFDTLVKS